MGYSRVSLTWNSISNANHSDGWNSADTCTENSPYHTCYRERIVRTIAFSVVATSRFLYSGKRSVYVGMQILTSRESFLPPSSQYSERLVKSRTPTKCRNVASVRCAVTTDISRMIGALQEFSFSWTYLCLHYSRNENFSCTVNNTPSGAQVYWTLHHQLNVFMLILFTKWKFQLHGKQHTKWNSSLLDLASSW